MDMIVVLLLFLGCTQSPVLGQQFQGCDFYQDLFVGIQYQIFSPGYDANYPAGTSCRWAAEAPPGYKVELVCDDIAMLWVLNLYFTS